MMRRKLAPVVALTVVALLSGNFTLAQTDRSQQRTIDVSGDGEMQAAPDQVTLQLAIETRATTAAQAASSNAALAQKVRDALKAKLDNRGKLWTGGYSLDPDYSQPRNGGEARILGYRAQNSITVQTGALDSVGPLIDAAMGAGANRVDSLDYDLKDNTQARGQAIAKAAKDAQAQAQALANALGLRLGPVVKASTVAESRPVPVFRREAGAMMSNAATPIEARQITVPATVSLSYEIQ